MQVEWLNGLEHPTEIGELFREYTDYLVAGDPVFAPLLLGMGVSALSMTPNCAAKIRYILRHTDTDSVRKLARAVLAEPEPRNIQERLTLFMNSILPETE